MDGRDILTVLFMLISLGLAEECVRTGNCACRTPSGRLVDLNPLSVSGPQPRFTVEDGKKNTYYFNPCKAVVQTDCNNKLGANVAMCQKTSGSSESVDAGDLNSQAFSGDPADDTLVITYTGTTAGILRTSRVTLKCSDGDALLVFDKENPDTNYYFTLHQSYTCPPSDNSGLSTGSILLIIFFVLLIVYWVGGILFMKFVRRAEGVEMIPNYEFWSGLPSLIRDGIMFTVRGCKGESTYEKI